MEWEPDEQAWHTYIKFELRYKELDRARQIYERFVYVHPEVGIICLWVMSIKCIIVTHFGGESYIHLDYW